MAAVTLGAFNTVSVPVSVTQLVTAARGHFYFSITNSGTGNLFVSDANTVGANATSYKVLAGATMPTFQVWGPSGAFVFVDVAGPISVMVIPRG